MFPHFDQPVLASGPIVVHAFGVLAAAGIVVRYVLAVRRTRVSGLDSPTGSALAMWMVVAGLAGAHLAGLAQRGLFTNPAALVRFWDGMSSFGGLLAGIGSLRASS